MDKGRQSKHNTAGTQKGGTYKNTRQLERLLALERFGGGGGGGSGRRRDVLETSTTMYHQSNRTKERALKTGSDRPGLTNKNISHEKQVIYSLSSPFH